MLKVSIHERIDELVGSVARQLAEPVVDPFEAPLLVAPTHGMARFLVQQLASHLGILANAPVVRPAGFRERVMALQPGGLDSIEPWSKHSMAWGLFAVAPATVGDYAGAYALARLFDRYHVHRPDMICRWATGQFVDVRGDALSGTRLLQAQLWHQLRTNATVPSPPELFAATPPTIASAPDPQSGGPSPIPRRVFLVGLTEVSPLLARLCVGLGASGRQVEVSMLRPAVGALDRWSAPFTIALDVWDQAGVVVEASAAEPFRGDLAAGAAARPPVVAMHRCHGTVRQLENLRDAIAGYLADDPTLTEADILVAVAQPERFGPLIDAVWGRSAEVDAPADRDDGPPALRYSLASGSTGVPSDAVFVFRSLLSLLGGRYRASDVLAFLGLAPVRARFGWTASDADSIADLVERSGIRWGLDGRSRTAAGFADACDNNSWRFGLDRMLIGALVGDGESVGEAVGFGVESDTLRLAERLAQAIDVFAGLEQQSVELRTVGEWTRTLLDAHDQLTRYDQTADRSREQLTRAVARVQPSLADPAVPCADVVRALQLGLEPGGRSAAAAPGAITVAPMHDLRGVPFRVIALLGADAAAFGSGDSSAPDDLSVRPPMLGDVARREADRQVVAELFSAASDRFAVFFDGHDERTGADVPAATLLEELAEMLTAATPPVAIEVFDERRTATDPANFVGSGQSPAQTEPPQRSTPSFDAAAAVTARSLVSPADGAGALRPLNDRLPKLSPIAWPERLELATLARFIDDPLTPLLAERARATAAGQREAAPDALPIDPDGLALWKLRSEALEIAQLPGDGTGSSRLVGLQRQWVRDGRLLPGELGARTALAASTDAAEVLAAARGAGAPVGAPERVHLDIPSTSTGVCRLVGDTEVIEGADGVRQIVRISASRRKLSQLVGVWVELMALVLAEPDRPHRAVYACKVQSSSSKGPAAEAWTLVPQDPIGSSGRAQAALQYVMEQYNDARRTVVPLFAATTFHLSEGDRSAARKAWQGNKFGGDGDKPATAAILGRPSFAQLCAAVDVDGAAEAFWHGAIHASSLVTPPGTVT